MDDAQEDGSLHFVEEFLLNCFLPRVQQLLWEFDDPYDSSVRSVTWQV